MPQFCTLFLGTLAMSHYTAPSQILERQQYLLQHKKILIAGEAEDNYPILLAQHCKQVQLFTTHYGYYQQMQPHTQLQCYFGVELEQSLEADILILYWPKAKKEAAYLLAMLLPRLALGTEVIVVGENRSGIKSIEKLFTAYGNITKYDAARRCSFYHGVYQHQAKPFVLQEWFSHYTMQHKEHSLTIYALPGVFSQNELDFGSRLLLDSLPVLSGKVLDVGCGAGVLGAVTAKLNPDIELHLCDVNALALRSTEETLKANQLTAHVFASDVYSHVDNQYHFIISNPPFHSGLDTNYQATEQLISQAKTHLTPNGQLWIVANRFLPYPDLIERIFGQCTTKQQTNKFSIYQAQKKR